MINSIIERLIMYLTIAAFGGFVWYLADSNGAGIWESILIVIGTYAVVMIFMFIGSIPGLFHTPANVDDEPQKPWFRPGKDL